MKRTFLSLLILGGAFILLFEGCAVIPDYQMMVNTYLNDESRPPFTPGAGFCILKNDESVNPLLEKKLEKMIQALLEESGFKVVPMERADYGLDCRYGSETGQVLEGHYEPDYWGPSYFYGGYGPHYPWGWYSGGRYVAYTRIETMHNLRVYVFDGIRYRGDGTREMVWVGECASLSPSPDQRTALAYMFRALFDHFGEDTGKGVEIKISVDDPRVLLLR